MLLICMYYFFIILLLAEIVVVEEDHESANVSRKQISMYDPYQEAPHCIKYQSKNGKRK